ncbi:MAG: hypothetical protein AAFN74_27205, partial [Myxococcota bacterium]
MSCRPFLCCLRLAVWRCHLWALAGLIVSPVAASAKPVAPLAFCDVYTDAPACAVGVVDCAMCHLQPPERNAFGQMIEAQILPGAPRPLADADFLTALPIALQAVETLDADGDGANNRIEIEAGTQPGNATSRPQTSDCDGENVSWNVCGYDARYVFKKVYLDFCGVSPTYNDMQAFDRAPDAQQLIRQTLDACLDSDFWIGQDGQLWQLAHRKIRPIQAIKAGANSGPIPLADYDDDYALFVYTHIDDHDVRDVLTADYFVTRAANPTRYRIASSAGAVDQNVVANRRAGMLTTKWNLVLNVMFTALPRTAAAMAYRGYLGLDIARLQGLLPVAGEPVDYDDTGVTAPTCAVCHSTLDPLSYPFKNYHGLTGRNGTYDSTRIQRYFSNESARITEMPEAGVIFGQPVANLTAWARVAADSDAFAVATVADLWKLLMGGAPSSEQQLEFQRLWQNLKTVHGYRVERMLHELVQT